MQLKFSIANLIEKQPGGFELTHGRHTGYEHREERDLLPSNVHLGYTLTMMMNEALEGLEEAVCVGFL